jgi:hypothetical protein
MSYPSPSPGTRARASRCQKSMAISARNRQVTAAQPARTAKTRPVRATIVAHSRLPEPRAGSGMMGGAAAGFDGCENACAGLLARILSGRRSAVRVAPLKVDPPPA